MRYTTTTSVLILVLSLFSNKATTADELKSSQGDLSQNMELNEMDKKIEKLTLEQQQSEETISQLQADLRNVRQEIDLMKTTPELHSHGR